MARFCHLILTPFNIRTAGAPGLEEGWLEHRFDLFESFCYPSVRAQSCPDFTWLVFLDVETPSRFKKRLDELARGGALEPVYIEGLRDYLEPTLERIPGGTTHLISTTLDNDDALAVDFVARVQAEFHGQEFELLNFPNGFRLDLGRRRLYTHRVAANPFISLIERNHEVKTIRGCGPHDLLAAKFKQIREVETDPLWLQVVHGRNIAVTGVWGCRRVPLTRLRDRFALAAGLERFAERSLSIRLENLRRTAERVAIERLGPRGVSAARRALKAVRGRR